MWNAHLNRIFEQKTWFFPKDCWRYFFSSKIFLKTSYFLNIIKREKNTLYNENHQLYGELHSFHYQCFPFAFAKRQKLWPVAWFLQILNLAGVEDDTDRVHSIYCEIECNSNIILCVNVSFLQVWYCHA